MPFGTLRIAKLCAAAEKRQKRALEEIK